MMLLASVACNKETQTDNQPSVELKPQVTLSFNAALTTPTKTEIGNSETADGVTVHEIYWSKDDKIAVYPHDPESNSGVAGVEFTSEDLVETSAAEAVFTGEIDAADTYYAFYPTTAGAKWYGEYSDFSVTLPSEQVANGIASGFAVANVTGTEKVTFDHVCGFVKFTIDETYAGKIKEVRFSGKNSEALAGKLFVYPDDMNENKINSSQQTVLTLSPSAGETFAAGTYYFTCFPVELTKGLELTFVDSDDKEAVKSSDVAATIERAGVLNLGTVAKLEFESVTPPLEDGDYAVMVKVGETYKALSSNESGTRLAAIGVTYDGSVSKLSISDATAIWNFKNTSAKKYNVTNSAKYLNHSGTSNTADATVDASECEVVDNGDGTYRVQLDSDQLRYLAYNTSDYFAFYGTNTSCDYNLYLIPAAFVQLPVITVNAEPEMLASDDMESKELSVTISHATSISVKVYGEKTLENEIYWLTATYSEGKLTYSATIENSEANERMAYVCIYASNDNGNYSCVIEICQSGSVNYSKYTLFSTDIASVGVKWAYTDADIKTITATDDSVWKVYQSYRSATDQNTVQLKINDNPGYLLSPTTSSAIKKIDVTLKGGSDSAILSIKSTSDVELTSQTVTKTQTKYTFNLTGTDTAVKFTSSNGTIYIQEVVIYY